MTDYRMRLVLDNQHDHAQLSASSSRSGAPVEYTQRNERNRVWRAANAGEQTISGELIAGAFVDTCALVNHNLSALSTCRLELLSGGTVEYDSGVIDAGDIIPAGTWRAGIDPWGATYNDRIDRPATIIETPISAVDSYRITVSDSLSNSRAIEIGRIVLGLSFRPTYNMSYGVQATFVDNATHEYSAGQTLRTIGGGAVRRQHQISLEWLEPGDRSMLIQHLAQRGMVSDVFIDLYPNNPGIERQSAAYLARMSSGYTDTHSYYRNSQTTITFMEI